ncbi:hypothetical protein BSKO_08711 [Bryopsis sp. KO-2023]|nr:hypothetical protein BSKO_08711 [Bryopsis sp. KO-2023]
MPSGSDILDALDTLHVAVEGIRDKTIGLCSRATRRGSWRVWPAAGYDRVGDNGHEDVDDEEKKEEKKSKSGDFPPLTPGPISFYDNFRIVNGVPAFLLEIPQPASLSKTLPEEVTVEYSEDDPNGVTCCEFSSDGSRIVSGYQNGSVRVWNALRGVLEFEKLDLHPTHVTDVSFMGNQHHMVASIDLTGRYHVWDLHNGSTAFVNCESLWKENGVEKPVMGRPHFEHGGLKAVVAVERRSPVAGPSREADTGERETALGIEFNVSAISTIPVFYGKAVTKSVPEGSYLTDCQVSPSGTSFFASFVPHLDARKNLEGWTVVWPEFIAQPAANSRLSGGLAAWSRISDYIVTWSPPLPLSNQTVPRFAMLWRVAASAMDQTEGRNKTIVKDPAGGNICWCNFVDNFDKTLTRTLACCVWTPGQEISVVFYDIVNCVFMYSIKTGVDPAPNSWALASRFAWEESLRKNVKNFRSVGLTTNRSQIGIFSGNDYKGVIVNGPFGVQELKLDIPIEFRWAIGDEAGIVMGHTAGSFAVVGSDSILLMCPHTSTSKPGQLAEALVCEDVSAPLDNPVISQFSGNGRLLGVLRVGSSSLHVWDLEGGRMHSVDVNGHSRTIYSFAFSFQGDQIVTLSRDQTVTLWELLGSKLRRVGKIVKIGTETGSSIPMATMGFTRNAAGAKAIVVCDHHGDLIWIVNAAPAPVAAPVSERGGALFTKMPWNSTNAKKALKRGPFSKVKQLSVTERGMGKHSCRFSADGEKGLLMPSPQRVEVWDLVNRKRTHTFEYKVPLKVDGRVSGCGSVDMSGVCAVMGSWNEMEDLVFCNPGTAAEELSEKVEQVSNNLVISENGRWILTDGFHASDEKSASPEPSKAIYLIDKSGVCETRILRGFDLHPSRVLNISPDGRWVICAAEKNKIKIWTSYAASGLMPSYKMLAMDKLDDDKEFLEALLDRFGPALFNLLDATGMSFMMHAVADLNFGVFRTMMEWGLNNEMKIRFRAICGSNYYGASGEQPCKEPTNAIVFAIQRRSPDFVRRIYDALVKGLVHEHEKAFILQESLVDISNTYPAIMEDILNDERIFTNVCKIEMPEEVFRQLREEVITATDNRLTAPAYQIQQDWDKRTENVHGIRVPAQVRSIAYPFVAQIGFKGLLSPLLVGNSPSSAFSSPIVRYIINYKWQEYAKRLVVNEMLHYVVMLVMFTIYSIIMGTYNWPTKRDMMRHWAGIVAIVLLICSSFLALLNLLRELQQIRVHVTSSGWKGLMYYGDSAWNWTEIGTYILLVFVIPVVQFKGSPQDNVMLSILLAIEAIFLWWKILYYMRAFKATGPLVIFIGNIIANITTFLVLAFMVLFGFGVAFFVLYRHVVHLKPEVQRQMTLREEELDNIQLAFGTLGQTLVTMFAFTLGDFDLEVLYNINISGAETPSRFTGIIFFVVYMFAIAVIILNLLIAVMGDSYDRIKNAQEMAFFKARAVAIHDVETMMSTQTRREKRAKIQCYLHIVEPVDKIKDEDAAQEWQGRVLDLQRRFRRIIKTRMSKTTHDIKDVVEISNRTAEIIKNLDRDVSRQKLAAVRSQGGSTKEDYSKLYGSSSTESTEF